jgi:phage gp36-like protein
MLYITNTDIERRLGSAAYVQLTDDDGDGSADVGVVDEARLAAEGAVNSFLAKRYSVPVNLVAHSELADLLASVTLDLAEYRLRARRPPGGLWKWLRARSTCPRPHRWRRTSHAERSLRSPAKRGC